MGLRIGVISSALVLLLAASGARADNVKVLWDISHKVVPYDLDHVDYHPLRGAYKNFIAYMAANGFDLEVNQKEFARVDLTPYRIILVSASTSFEPYTEADARKVKEFVDSCGGLMVFSENFHLQPINDNLAPLVKGFGISLGVAPLLPDYSSILLPVPEGDRKGILSGVQALSMNFAGAVSAKSPGKVLLRDQAGSGAIATAADDRVIAIGDSNFIDDGNITEDNKKFIINVFNHVAEQSPGPDGCGGLPTIGD